MTTVSIMTLSIKILSHNDSQHYHTRHNNTQHKEGQHNDSQHLNVKPFFSLSLTAEQKKLERLSETIFFGQIMY
jgi:hypothetical protein